MSRKCSICEHLSRKDIDQLLISGNMSYSEIAIQFGTSKASLSRHKRKHLREQTAKAINHVLAEFSSVKHASQIRTGMQILEALDDLYSKVMRIYQEAIRESTDPPQPSEGPFEWSDVVTLARRMRENRREALMSIREMSRLLGQYGDFLPCSLELQRSEKVDEPPLPKEVEEMLKQLESG